MPLSEREQRIFDEISTSLQSEDPRFARPLPEERPPAPADPRRRARMGAALFACGFVMLLVFFLTRSLPVGLLAFAGMVAGASIVAGAVRNAVASRPRKARTR